MTLVLPLLACAGGAMLHAEDADDVDDRLDRLEIRVIERSPLPPRISDMQTRQDLGVVEQELRSLKTRKPNRRDIPLLERQLDRTKRPVDIIKSR
jgi:hypothetical protein